MRGVELGEACHKLSNRKVGITTCSICNLEVSYDDNDRVVTVHISPQRIINMGNCAYI